MRAGRLRHRITIQQPVITRDGTGESLETWGAFAVVWAAVEPLRGREMFAAQEMHSEITTRIRLRYLAGIDTTMRVLFEGRTFLIVHPPIDPEMRHVEMQLMCKEIW
jgi:SPP1 family predicted phage head-tail adaptor